MADEKATVARLKGLLARIRSRLRPGDECAVQCQSDDIVEAMLCLRHLDPGLMPVAVRLGEGFRRVMGDTVGEWLAELASDQGPEYRQQLTELFGPFPESTDEADESVSVRRAVLEGRVVQLSELVDDVFAVVERVYPSAGANPQGGKSDNAGTVHPQGDAGGGAAAAKPAGRTRPKKSTIKGEAKAKLIGALTKHHKYADDGCLNLEPIGCRALARLAGLPSGSSASRFFHRHFEGYAKYRTICRLGATELALAIKVMRGELRPRDVPFGRTPPGEGGSEDE